MQLKKEIIDVDVASVVTLAGVKKEVTMVLGFG